MFRNYFLIYIFVGSTHGILCIYCRIYFPNSYKCTFMNVAIISSRLSTQIILKSYQTERCAWRQMEILRNKTTAQEYRQFLWNQYGNKLWADHKLFKWKPQTLICLSASFIVMLRTVNLKTYSCLFSGEISTRPNHRVISEFSFEVLCTINGIHQACLCAHVCVRVCVCFDRTQFTRYRGTKRSSTEIWIAECLLVTGNKLWNQVGLGQNSWVTLSCYSQIV